MRDYVMARLLAARASTQAAIEAIDAAAILFVDPEEDKSGKEREEFLDAADAALGEASRAVQQGAKALEDLEVDDLLLSEGDLDDDEEEPDGD